jgi:hypothetical protein
MTNYNQQFGELEEKLNKFSLEQRQIIYQHLNWIELTEGCSIHCDFCGADSKYLTKKKIPFELLEKIKEEMEPDFSIGNTMHFYHATDPLDYEDKGYNYFDVKKLFSSVREFCTITSIPKGKEELAIANLKDIDRISISHMNRERLIPFFDGLKIGVFIDFYNSNLSRLEVEKAPMWEYNHSGNILVKYPFQEEAEKLLMRKIGPQMKARFYDLRTDKQTSTRKDIQENNGLFLFCGDSSQDSDSHRIEDKDYTGVSKHGRAFDHFEGSDNSWFSRIKKELRMTVDGIFMITKDNPTIENITGEKWDPIDPKRFNLII